MEATAIKTKAPHSMTMADIICKSNDELRIMFRENLQEYYTLPMWVYTLLPDDLKKIYWEEFFDAGRDFNYFEWEENKGDDAENRFLLKEMVKFIPEKIKEDFNGCNEQHKADNDGEPFYLSATYKRILKPILK